jgi:hypothetical protein
VGRTPRRPGRGVPDDQRIIAVDGDTAVVRVEVFYGEPIDQEYRDLWIIRFADDGRCHSFEEWPFWPPGSEGEIPPGPQA